MRDFQRSRAVGFRPRKWLELADMLRPTVLTSYMSLTACDNPAIPPRQQQSTGEPSWKYISRSLPACIWRRPEPSHCPGHVCAKHISSSRVGHLSYFCLMQVPLPARQLRPAQIQWPPGSRLPAQQKAYTHRGLNGMVPVRVSGMHAGARCNCCEWDSHDERGALHAVAGLQV